MPTKHSLFQRVPIEVPNLSGFDMSHENCFTAFTGTLTPALVDDLLPKDNVSLGVNCQVQTVPFATDFYGTIEAKFEAFFVPFRILYHGWQQFITSPNVDVVYGTNVDNPSAGSNLRPGVVRQPDCVPRATLPKFLFTACSLGDYLDIQCSRQAMYYLEATDEDPASYGLTSYQTLSDVSLMSFLAYHKIYDDWYRDSRLQVPVFVDSAENFVAGASLSTLAGVPRSLALPWVTFYQNAGSVDYDLAADTFEDLLEAYLAQLSLIDTWEGDLTGIQDFLASDGGLNFLNTIRSGMYDAALKTAALKLQNAFCLFDGASLFSLRQRNWYRDYFTNATTTPQAGNPARVAFGVDSSVSGDLASGVGSFSIASLRAANAIQHFLEVNNYAGDRYGDQIRAQFGIYPSDATTQRAIYLGSVSVPVYTKSVYAQSEVDPSSIEGRNPFGTVGTKFGNAQGVGSGSLVDNFTASEHGQLFVIFSLVPHAFYGTGTHKRNFRTEIGDFAFPNLAGVGDESISKSELSADPGSSATFGYTQRYSSYKFKNDAVHGLLRDGESLSAFALKRSFGMPDEYDVSLLPSLGSEFLQIPRNFLDDVSAVAGSSSKYGCWVDCHFSYKKVSTLPAYSIPTLEDPKNTHTEVIPLGGTRL